MTKPDFSAAIDRRTALRASAVAGFGLAAAALLGCGVGASPTIAPPTKGALNVPNAGTSSTNPKVDGKQLTGGTFTSVPLTASKQHDMHTALGTTEWNLISEKALEIHPLTGEVLPHMVEKYEIADPQGLTLTLKLRNDLRLHNIAPWNGRPFTAEDLAWNLTRIAGMTADSEKLPRASFQRASMIANLVKAEAVDGLTVKVTLSKPNSAFFNGLTENHMSLMPKEIVDIGFADPMKFGGVGPWQIAANVPDERQDFVRFPQYFRPNEPHFDKVVQQVVPDRVSSVSAFLSGQVQTLLLPVAAETQTVKRAKPDASYYSWVDTYWDHLRPNLGFTPFADFRVRKAVHLAIDYKDIGDQFWGDGWSYQAALNPAYPEAWKQEKVRSLPGFNPDTKAQDRTSAKQLMAAAGFVDGAGVDFEMLYTDIGEAFPLEANALRFQDQMKTVFPQMKMTLRKLDFAGFAVPQSSGQFQMSSYVIAASPDAVLEAISQYHSNGSRNYGKFNEPAADAVLDKAIIELKRDARTQLLDDFQQQWVQNWQPLFVLHAQPARAFVQGNIGGFDTTSGPWFGFGPVTKIGRWFYVDR